MVMATTSSMAVKPAGERNLWNLIAMRVLPTCRLLGAAPRQCDGSLPGGFPGAHEKRPANARIVWEKQDEGAMAQLHRGPHAQRPSDTRGNAETSFRRGIGDQRAISVIPGAAARSDPFDSVVQWLVCCPPRRGIGQLVQGVQELEFSQISAGHPARVPLASNIRSMNKASKPAGSPQTGSRRSSTSNT